MSRRNKKKWILKEAPHKQPIPPRVQLSKDRSLFAIDNEPILDGLRDEYHKALKRAEQLEQEIQKFNGEDLVIFREWLNSTFGGLLTFIRELNEECARLTEFYTDVEFTAYERGIDFGEAYRYCMAEKEGTLDTIGHYFSKPTPFDDSEDEADNPGDYDEQLDEVMGIAETLGKMYKAQTGHLPPGFQDFMDEAEKVGAERKASSSQAENFYGEGFDSNEADTPKDQAKARETKDVYRTIVLRLHPDRVVEFTPYFQTLWNEAQTAYASGDLPALQFVLARIDSSTDVALSITRVSLLKDLIAKVKGDIKLLDQQLAEIRESPAWQFTTQGVTPEFSQSVYENLLETSRDAHHQLEAVKDELSEWEEEGNLWWSQVTAPKIAKKKKAKRDGRGRSKKR